MYDVDGGSDDATSTRLRRKSTSPSVTLLDYDSYCEK